MPETPSSTNPSLHPRFRLLFISLYEFLVRWLLSQQDSLSAALHVSKLCASWFLRLHIPEFLASWILRLPYTESVLTTPGLSWLSCLAEWRVFQFHALTLIARVRLCLFALKFVSLVLVCVCLVSPVSLLVTPRLCSRLTLGISVLFVTHCLSVPVLDTVFLGFVLLLPSRFHVILVTILSSVKLFVSCSFLFLCFRVWLCLV